MKIALFSAMIVLLAAPALAAPPPPAGWSPADGAPTKATASAKRSRAVTIDVEPLPRLDLEPAASFERTTFREETTPAPEVLTFGTRVTIKNHRMGGVGMSFKQESFGAFADGGVWTSGTHGLASFGWTSFDPAADGGVAIEAMLGFYDLDKHRAFELSHRRMKATPIAGSVYAGFIVACTRCAAGERERLHLVGPGSASTEGGAAREATWGALAAYTSLPLEAGTAGSVRTFVNPSEIAGWNKRLGIRNASPAASPASFHASRGAADEHAVVTARLEDP